MSGAFLNTEESQKLRRGSCPHCGAGNFQAGPRGGLGRNMLCGVCYREYCVGPVGPVEILNDICSAERLKEIYGITFPKSKTEDPFL